MTDADLNSLFAEKVAGWTKLELFTESGPAAPDFAWHVPGTMGTPMYSNPKYGPTPAFTASMDAVLPYLEKKGRWQCDYGRPVQGQYRIYFPHDSTGEATDPSLPRACVLALLRAAGVAV